MVAGGRWPAGPRTIGLLLSHYHTIPYHTACFIAPLAVPPRSRLACTKAMQKEKKSYFTMLLEFCSSLSNGRTTGHQLHWPPMATTSSGSPSALLRQAIRTGAVPFCARTTALLLFDLVRWPTHAKCCAHTARQRRWWCCCCRAVCRAMNRAAGRGLVFFNSYTSNWLTATSIRRTAAEQGRGCLAVSVQTGMQAEMPERQDLQREIRISAT